MITDVPTAADFADHGFMFLNLAWDTVFDLILEHADANQFGGAMEELDEAYWQAAKRPLSIAHALAQQGAELVLKSQIATVSPFLLVSAPPSDWPRGCDRADTAFADFRTVDAQDLIRACNAVRQSALPQTFVTTFDKFRKQRNALFHTVDQRPNFSDKEVVQYILQTAHLASPGDWPQRRKTHLEQQPIFAAYVVDDVVNRLSQEMTYMIEMLGRAELSEFFGFDKNQRRYICPVCYQSMNRDYGPPHPRTAQLHPNTPASTNVHCFVCGSDTTVVRNDCRSGDCNGNVINASDDHECLTCYEPQEEPEQQ